MTFFSPGEEWGAGRGTSWAAWRCAWEAAGSNWGVERAGQGADSAPAPRRGRLVVAAEVRKIVL